MKNVLRVQGIVSRFSMKYNINPKRHTVYIQFDPNDFHETMSYCDCKSGARTAGGCSHAVAVLTYIFYERNDETPP